MKDRQPQPGERALGQPLAFLQYGLRFAQSVIIDLRQHDVRLPAGGDLLPDELVRLAGLLTCGAISF